MTHASGEHLAICNCPVVQRVVPSRVYPLTVDGAGIAVLHAVVAVADGSVRTKDEMRVF